MDFGLTDDQSDILRTARELLAERAKPERVREHAEARTTDDALWKELCELGWPGIAIAEEHGGQGFGAIELGLLAEELGRTVAPVPFLPTTLAATLISHAGSAEQQQKWLPGLAERRADRRAGRARPAARRRGRRRRRDRRERLGLGGRRRRPRRSRTSR